MKCSYCNQFYRSKALPRGSKDGLKFDGARLCIAKDKMIKPNDEQCEYYQPTEALHCDKLDMQVHPLQCLSRRFNRLNLEGFQPCRKCKQFESNISQIITEYYINCKKVKPLPIQEVKKKPDEPKIKRKRRKIVAKPKLNRRIKKK